MIRARALSFGLLVLLAQGCFLFHSPTSESLDGGSGERDASRPDAASADASGADASRDAGVVCEYAGCVDELCCREEREASYDDECNAVCPPHFLLVSECVAESPSCLPLPDFECREDDECSVHPTTCCATCSDRAGYDALNESQRRRHETECGDVDCECAPARHLRAECRVGECILVDDVAPFAECARDEDCMLEIDGCCACGGTYVGVARERRGEFRDYVCPTREVGCDDCAPVRPATIAECVAGQCRARE